MLTINARISNKLLRTTFVSKGEFKKSTTFFPIYFVLYINLQTLNIEQKSMQFVVPCVIIEKKHLYYTWYPFYKTFPTKPPFSTSSFLTRKAHENYYHKGFTEIKLSLWWLLWTTNNFARCKFNKVISDQKCRVKITMKSRDTIL